MDRLAAAHEQYERENGFRSSHHEQSYLAAYDAYKAKRAHHYLENPEDKDLDVLLMEDGHLLQWIKDSQIDPLESTLQLRRVMRVIAQDLAESDAEDADYDTIMGIYDPWGWK